MQTHPDGSRVMWVRAKDRLSVAKYDFAPNGALSFLTHLRLDKEGNPLNAKIRNDRNEVIYQASYGYHRDTGTLVAELLFDKRPEAAPEPGQMVPVRRVKYGVDAAGRETHEIEQLPVVLADNGAEPAPLPSPFSPAVFPKGW
ncbi:MAG: hypothetical protein EOP88_02735 [Verrucomicrobiaceae bacterium]|nr:MAG: hypothetical protein EOP88_02735 [Verrucomicrobiaceae bacterium]